MRYPVDVQKVRGMQNAIWNRIRGTFALPRGARALPIYGHYGGVFEVGGQRLVIHCDGVGTKVLVAQQLGRYDTVGIDAMAMNANDILCLGARPLVSVDYIALSQENETMMEQLMKGLVEGARQSECAIIGGETAIVPELLRDEKTFDLTVTMVGKIEREIITGEKIQDSDVLIGLESSGLHSNGYTLARKVLDRKKWGKEMLEPTRIYVKPVLAALEEFDIRGMAHITGGAFSKLTRLGKDNGFVLDAMPKMPAIFETIARAGVDMVEMYRTFNCGIGFVLAIPKEKETDVHAFLKKRNIPSYTIGHITQDPKQRGVWLDREGKRIELTLC